MIPYKSVPMIIYITYSKIIITLLTTCLKLMESNENKTQNKDLTTNVSWIMIWLTILYKGSSSRPHKWFDNTILTSENYTPANSDNPQSTGKNLTTWNSLNINTLVSKLFFPLSPYKSVLMIKLAPTLNFFTLKTLVSKLFSHWVLIRAC